MASRRILAASLILLAGACVRPSPTTFDEFEATLATRQSATEALQIWCGKRRLAYPPTIAARPVATAPVAASTEIRKLLDVGPGMAIGYRNVGLTCGSVVMSRAQNWYVPSRLTAEMNQRLEGSDAPFGQVVRPLGFTRRLLESQRGGAGWCPSGTILSHRAILTLPNGTPFSLVVECYTDANLGGR